MGRAFKAARTKIIAPARAVSAGLKKGYIMKKDRPILEVKPHSYQPSKAEKEKIIAYNCSIDEAVNTLFQQVTIKKGGVG